ncbi:MAG: adenylate/guanylate cyclase domain-containing protein [Actinobacteria bacterium]|nr:adenylate/guanylate cyclase domain-containing protein [Actinomycetota bacterium]
MNIEFPEVRYAEADGVHIAYEVRGEGPIDLVRLPALMSGIVAGCLDPVARVLHTRLASFSRLIRIDRRGVGLSDPLLVGGAPPLEQQAEDVVAVMAAVGSQRVALFGSGDAGPLAVFFAAMHPERVTALIILNSVPAGMRDDRDAALDEVRQHWGNVDSPWLLDRLAPSRLDEPGFARLFAQLQQVSASKAAAAASYGLRFYSDVTPVLSLVQAPTLLLAPEASPLHRDAAEFFAGQIAGARVATYPGADIYFGIHTPAIADMIEEFLTGARPVVVSDRVLATVLFVDIVSSTERATELGDRAWRDLLDRFRATVRENLRRYRGREINTRGDDFLATFDGPARAIHCAEAITSAAVELDVEVRNGLHTGEVEVMGDDLAGIAVHVGARVCALARAGEVLVTSVVRDLVAGSGIDFAEHSRQVLKGVSGEWTILSVA